MHTIFSLITIYRYNARERVECVVELVALHKFVMALNCVSSSYVSSPFRRRASSEPRGTVSGSASEAAKEIQERLAKLSPAEEVFGRPFVLAAKIQVFH